jgi:hypothetical protein
MKMIEELEKLGVELTDEQKSAIEKKSWNEFISVAESDKKVQKVQEQLDTANEKLANTEEALKAFDGVDADGMKQKIAELEEANKQKDAEYKAALEKRDYHDAIEGLVSDIKFTSNAAKKQFIADLEANPLQMRDGKVLGFDDYLKNVKESDPDSFVNEDDEKKPVFTTPMGSSKSTEPVSGDPNKMDYDTYKKWREQNA